MKEATSERFNCMNERMILFEGSLEEADYRQKMGEKHLKSELLHMKEKLDQQAEEMEQLRKDMQKQTEINQRLMQHLHELSLQMEVQSRDIRANMEKCLTNESKLSTLQAVGGVPRESLPEAHEKKNSCVAEHHRQVEKRLDEITSRETCLPPQVKGDYMRTVVLDTASSEGYPSSEVCVNVLEGVTSSPAGPFVGLAEGLITPFVEKIMKDHPSLTKKRYGGWKSFKAKWNIYRQRMQALNGGMILPDSFVLHLFEQCLDGEDKKKIGKKAGEKSGNGF